MDWRTKLFSHPSLQRLLRNTGWLFAGETIATGVSIVQFPLVTRLLGAEAFGQLHLALAWAGLVVGILSLQLRNTIVKYLSEYLGEDATEKIRALVKLGFGLDIAVSLCVFGVLVGTAAIAAPWWINTPQGAQLIQAAALVKVCAMTQGVSGAILRVFDRYKWLSTTTTAITIFLFLMLVPVLFLAASPLNYLRVMAISGLTQSAILLWLALRELHRHGVYNWWGASFSALRTDAAGIREMLVSMYFNSLRKAATNDADLLILGQFTGDATVGVYKLAKQLAGYLNRLSNPVYNAVYPEIARLYAESGSAALLGFVRRLFLIAVAILVPAVGLIYLFARPLVPLIFGAEYATSVSIFLILVLGNIWLVFIWAPGFLMTLGRAKDLTLINLAASFIFIVLGIWFTIRWEAIGMAWAFVANYALWVVMMAVYLWRLKLPPSQAETVAG